MRNEKALTGGAELGEEKSEVRYGDWLAGVPDALKNDPIWKFKAYPKALLLYDLSWQDVEKLTRDVRGRAVGQQLIRSSGSITANIDEGFGRGVEGGEYLQFLRYALGSARETRSWYYKARKLLSNQVVEHRIALCNEVIALLVTAMQRRKQARSQSSNF
jgi:four helix bundle protein